MVTREVEAAGGLVSSSSRARSKGDIGSEKSSWSNRVLCIASLGG